MSLLLAVVVLVPALVSARSAVLATRDAVQQHHYADAVDAAGSLGWQGTACSAAMLLPGPLTLRVIPGGYVDALSRGCRILSDVGAAAGEPSVGTFARSLEEVGGLSGLASHPAVVQQGVDALSVVAPTLRRVIRELSVIADLGIPGGVAERLHSLVQAWPESRLEQASSLAKVVPALLGLDKPRTYFVGLESNAEMRATGGFLGQYAIVRVSAGKVKVLQIGPNTELTTPALPGVKLLAGSEAFTLTDNPMWVNTNLSPHGPDVGALWMYGWKQQTGQSLDGVIGIDITTAARLAAAAGATLTRPDGTVVSGAQAIADYAQNGVYFDFDGPLASGDPRKAYQLGALRDLLRHASAALLNPETLWNVMPTAIDQRRVLVRFASPSLQSLIAANPVAQDTTAGETSSVLVTWNNWAGNKFDYYMHATASAKCVRGGVDLRLDVSSSADPKRAYPAYIGQRLDTPSERRASVRDQFLFVLPEGADVRWLSVDGHIATYQVNTLGARPVVQLVLDTVAGGHHVVRYGVTGAVDAVRVVGADPVAVACG